MGLVCELNPISLRLSVLLKGHSTLSLSYLESGLIIMVLIIILFNTNKQSMPTLIRYDCTSKKIILYFSHKITFLPLLQCMKQVKSSNIKKGRNIQKEVRNLILKDTNTLSASSSSLIQHPLPLPLLYLHKSSLMLSLISFTT